MKAYPVTVLCKVMRVSRSGFYQYLKRINQGPENDPAETALKARIQAIFKAHRSKYGARRIMKELNNQGHQIGIYKVRRLMRELGLKAKSPRRYKVTTDSRHSFPVAPTRSIGSSTSTNLTASGRQTSPTVRLDSAFAGAHILGMQENALLFTVE
jgi:transposase InsO family protein